MFQTAYSFQGQDLAQDEVEPGIPPVCPPTAPDRPTADRPGSSHEPQDDCAICFDPIDISMAVMRCKNRPRCHYFHADCLRHWISSARANRQVPSCPVCRGEVEFNARNLEAYLSAAASGVDLDEEER